MKPPLELAGPANAPNSVPGTEGIAPDVVAATAVVSYNDLDALERVLRSGDIACFIVEPVMENIGICLPDEGYLAGVRELTSRYGTVLIFDEVKTGITAGYGGATGHFGIEPDLVTLAKSIGGGFPVGAFGGKHEFMDLITAGRVLHLGTYNGNPLVMAAARATLAVACDREATEEAIARNGRLVAACQATIDGAGLPAHTVQFGAKGCVTWRRERVRNYRDYRDAHLDAGLRPVDPRDQPRHPAASRPRRAVADLGDARRHGGNALRRRLRRVRRRAHRLSPSAGVGPRTSNRVSISLGSRDGRQPEATVRRRTTRWAADAQLQRRCSL